MNVNCKSFTIFTYCCIAFVVICTVHVMLLPRAENYIVSLYGHTWCEDKRWQKLPKLKMALLYKHQRSLNSLNLIKTNTKMFCYNIQIFLKDSLKNILKSQDAIRLAAFNIQGLLREIDEPKELMCTVRAPKT